MIRTLHHGLLGSVSISILAMLACVPARLSHEIASFQRELDRDLAAALEPREGSGLETACHRVPIVWMHFISDDNEDWRLMSVDERGQVGIWTKHGLEQTWSLREDELAWVRSVEERQHLSEDAEWLRARAKLPRPHHEFQAGAVIAAQLPDELAPRSDRRWVGIYSDYLPEPRLTASGDWYAVGDHHGNLLVARIAARRELAEPIDKRALAGPRHDKSMWVAYGCPNWIHALD